MIAQFLLVRYIVEIITFMLCNLVTGRQINVKVTLNKI